MKKKIVITFAIAIALFILWTLILKKIYAYLLYYIVHVVLLGVSQTNLDLFFDSGHPIYTVTSFINDKEFSWSLSGELFLLPMVLLLSWQVMLILILPKKVAIKTSNVNVLILFSCQVLFLLLLTMYWKYDLARIIHDMMNNNLIIIVIFLIIKDVISLNLLEKVTWSDSQNT